MSNISLPLSSVCKDIPNSRQISDYHFLVFNLRERLERTAKICLKLLSHNVIHICGTPLKDYNFATFRTSCDLVTSLSSSAWTLLSDLNANSRHMFWKKLLDLCAGTQLWRLVTLSILSQCRSWQISPPQCIISIGWSFLFIPLSWRTQNCGNGPMFLRELFWPFMTILGTSNELTDYISRQYSANDESLKDSVLIPIFIK